MTSKAKLSNSNCELREHDDYKRTILQVLHGLEEDNDFILRFNDKDYRFSCCDERIDFDYRGYRVYELWFIEEDELEKELEERVYDLMSFTIGAIERTADELADYVYDLTFSRVVWDDSLAEFVYYTSPDRVTSVARVFLEEYGDEFLKYIKLVTPEDLGDLVFSEDDLDEEGLFYVD